MSEPQSLRSLLGRSLPLVPPLFQSSVYTLPDLDALDRVMSGDEAGFIYARDGHPNARQLADRLTALEDARWTVITASGMAAITALSLASVSHGDRIIASNRLYGRTTQLFKEELGRYGVECSLVDTSDLPEVRRAFDRPARMLFVETLSNPLLRLADIPVLADLAHAHECRLAVDNTFATPVLCRPLELGADLVMESLTKALGGHSDVTLGCVSGREDIVHQVNRITSIWGLAANPFDCWLALRGLATLSVRLRAASANALALADWLARQSGVLRVVYPGRPDHPDAELAGRILNGACGAMLCFELEGGREAVNRFMRHAPGVPFSPSLGDTATTCSHPATTSHRYVSAAEKRRQGISDGLIRLSVGIEDFEAIRSELSRGLS